MSLQTSEHFFDNMSSRQRKRQVREQNKSSTPHMQSRDITVKGLNANQKRLIQQIERDTQIFVLGPAGTGKTYVTAAMASKLYVSGKINKIIITRPNIPSGPSLGFFPGSLNEKMAPWVAPITSVLKEKMGIGAFETGVKKGNIEVVPFETMRGSSFNDCFIILDEAQNVPLEEFKMFLTRTGRNSRVVINGDVKQSDLGQASGYKRILDYVSKYGMAETAVVEFTMEDCVRSGVVYEWLKIFDQEGV